MFYKKICVSDRHYLIRYPAFVPADHGVKKEIRAIQRMNGFYDTLKNEIIAYCTELSAENQKILYLADTECTVTDENGERTLCDGDEIPPEGIVTVRLSLVLRNRPNPSKRADAVYVWKGGYLVK